MKRKLTLLVLACLSVCIASKAQNHRGLDPTFGDHGEVITANGKAMAVLVQPDQKIVVTGTLQNTTTVPPEMTTIRYNTDGTLDNTFGINGKCVSGFPFDPSNVQAMPKTIKLQPDGKILISGSVTSGDIFVQRLKANGSVDSAFGHDGVASLTLAAVSSSYGAVMALQPDGKVVLAHGDDTNFYVVRFLSDGTLDNNFGTNGKFATYVSSNGGFLTGLDLMADGRIVLGGINASSYQIRTGRLLSNGTPDTTFAHTGFASPYTLFGISSAIDLHLQADGKIILGGNYGASGPDRAYLLRLNMDATVDTSFGGNMGHPGLFEDSTGLLQTFLLLPDRKILGGGGDRRDFFLFRTTANGKGLDATFGNSGIITTDIQGNNDYINSMALQQDGKIVAAGNSVGEINPTFRNDFTVVRYLQDAPTAVKHIGEPDGLRIYPNPATDKLTILSTANETIAQVDIIAGDGRLVRSISPVSTQISTAGIPSGLYYLKAYFTRGRQPAVQKLFIQR